ncbi:uncharacterized protein LOC133173342 [Saccostrea echinata]|uniref:uncharacterized protein LOC133173342 n=1 Tax=Saccostrea echinata TaxID=191078 RepID=UPI002A83F1D3|nr:uncharacterized protein LOC133173342 [Saccostrea echinata]
MNTNNSSFEHSPSVSEDANSSWVQSCEYELTALPDLHLGAEGSVELGNLVEDKEIAARAVAFVVNSTRKGIVPLCADVANLLRAKRRLEKKVFILKKEKDFLHSASSLSRQTSHSISPTPASYSSEKSAQAEFLFNLPSDRNRPCSRCSQCSTISSSPNFDKNRQRLSSLQYSPASSHGDEPSNRRQYSLRGKRSRSESCDALKEHPFCTTEAEIHAQPKDIEFDFTEVNVNGQLPDDNSLKDDIFDCDNIDDKSEIGNKNQNGCEMNEIEQNTESERKFTQNGQTAKCDSSNKDDAETLATVKSKGTNSSKKKSASSSSDRDSESSIQNNEMDYRESELSTLSERRGSGELVVEKYKSVTTTCSVAAEKSLEDKFAQSMLLNSKLTEELGAAKKEIEILKKRLSELEPYKIDSCTYDRLIIENEVGGTKMEYLEKKSLNNNNRQSKGSERYLKHKVTPISPYLSQPLYGCKCSACEAVFSSSEYIWEADQAFTEKRTFSVSHKLHVQQNDHVVAKGDRTGQIRYIGHLDKQGQSNLLFAGLELDSPVGRHDGVLNGKRYFSCPKDHGIFIPLQEIICKVGKKVPKKTPGREESSKLHRKKKNDRLLTSK